MAWPSKFYVGTSVLGVYYTENFAPTGAQPTWTAVNDGLPSTALRGFQADPYDLEGVQYALLSTGLYERRMGADWAVLLTAAEADVLTGGSSGEFIRFDVDLTVQGRIWIFYQGSGLYTALYTDDGGATWGVTASIATGAFLYEAGWILGRGSSVWATARTSAVDCYAYVSSDRGASWAPRVGLGSNWAHRLFWQRDVGEYAYLGHAEGSILKRVSIAGDLTNYTAGSPVGMWFNLDTPAHQRLVDSNEQMHVTSDSWANYSTAGDPAPGLVGPIAAWYGQATDEIVVALFASTGVGQPKHLVGVMDDEDDLAPTGRSGDSPGTSPFTDSIPVTAGVVLGIQAIIDFPSEGPAPPPGSTITPPDKPGEAPSVPITLGGDVLTQAVTMPEYDGTDRGVPIQGDRGAWDVRFYPAWHARDIAEATYQYHMDPTDPRASLSAFLDHSARHETGGDDEIDVTDLAGVLADAQNADRLQGRDVAAGAPADGEALVWDNVASEWAPGSVGAGDGNRQLVFSQVVNVTVEDTTDETTLLGAGRGAKTLPADKLVQGTVIAVVLHGHLGTTGTPNLTIKAALGGSDICSTGAQAMADTVYEVGFTIRIEIVSYTTGELTGSVVGGGTFEYDDDTQHKLVNIGAVGVDTTVPLLVDVTAEWGTASVLNTITAQVATIEIVAADALAVAAPSGLALVEV